MTRFPSSVEKILFAAEFAARKHSGQVRKFSTDPYVNHCLRVAQLVSHVGEPAISAAILHDTIEDTHTTYEELVNAFGSVIADIVLELTDPPASAGNRAARKKIARENVKSYYAKSIKCADNIDNLPSIVTGDPGFATVYVAELALSLPLLSGADPALYERLKHTYDAAKSALETP